jgi:nicotinamidase-related amidase
MSAAELLRPERAALLVIDLQEKLVPHIHGSDHVLRNVEKMLKLAEILELPTHLTTQYEWGLGATVASVRERTAAIPIDKVCFGCFGDAGFRQAIASSSSSASTLILAGIETHICVLQTALGALDAGYGVHVLADAAGARSPANHELGLARMRQAGCIISSTEMAIYELLGDSKRSEFKQMLPLLK